MEKVASISTECEKNEANLEKGNNATDPDEQEWELVRCVRLVIIPVIIDSRMHNLFLVLSPLPGRRRRLLSLLVCWSRFLYFPCIKKCSWYELPCIYALCLFGNARCLAQVLVNISNIHPDNHPIWSETSVAARTFLRKNIWRYRPQTIGICVFTKWLSPWWSTPVCGFGSSFSLALSSPESESWALFLVRTMIGSCRVDAILDPIVKWLEHCCFALGLWLARGFNRTCCLP